jgi:DNA-binding XRE family transcriptional regulator
MIMEKNIEKYSKWTPDLSPEAREHISGLQSNLEPGIALMRHVRQSLGLTQSEVAVILGVTQSNVSKIEMKGDPSLSVLARMAEAKNKKLKLAFESEDGTVEQTIEIG